MASKINLMGSEVVEGFTCKPKKLDPSKPIMHYRFIIYICSDERCAKAGSDKKAEELRQIVKELGFDRGENRIKISRNLCQGACRFRQVAQINENSPTPVNNSLWLKHTHKFTKDKWKKLFLDLVEGKKIDKNLIEMRVY